MAKIDVKSIAGYETMSAEDKVKALEAFDINDNASELEKYKGLVSKANSEAAEAKRLLKEKMSAEEIKAKEDADKQEKLQADYNALLKKVTISEHKAQFLALGYDEKLATETAEAMVAGDMTKVFANQKIHQAAIEKKVTEDLMKGTPKPGAAGDETKTVTKEQFDNMTYTERVKVFNETPELYAELTKE